MTPDLLNAPFAGRVAFHAAVRSLLAEAARVGWNDLQWCDADFADWPLDDASVLSSLTAWAHPRRHLTLLASNYEQMLRRHPSWVAWRRVRSHVVSCRRADDEVAADDIPTLVVAPAGVALRLFDRVRCRGVISTASVDVTRAHMEFDAILQRSTESFGATTLGL